MSHSWRWLSHFVGAGFNRQPLGRKEKQDLADASHRWRQCVMRSKRCRDAARQSTGVTLALADWRQLFHSCFTTARSFIKHSQLTSCTLIITQMDGGDVKTGLASLSSRRHTPLTANYHCCCCFCCWCCRASPQPPPLPPFIHLVMYVRFRGGLVPTALALWFWQLGH